MNKDELLSHYPLISDLSALRDVSWFNSGIAPADVAICDVGLTAEHVSEASARLQRFAPYLAIAFPELAPSGGIIESGIAALPSLQKILCDERGLTMRGALWIKNDNQLPISGSIKARGGIYEVLALAEDLAIKTGKLSMEDNYSKLADPEFRNFFSQYKISVGSTGNLGLSIGIMGAKLGFETTVHMSAGARAWKKSKLKDSGVYMIEHESDYSSAVEHGRLQAAADPTCYFVDDESSTRLFLGYAVAAERLQKQLDQAGIVVDQEHPLFVYLPCGVGGAPGGVTFGLKLIYGDNVYCIFAEPTHSPCMLLGVYTGLHDAIAVNDIGIDNITAADGLAVGRPSGFVGKAMHRLIDGYYTVSDDDLYRLLAKAFDSEGLRLEPSALAGAPGMVRVMENCAFLEKAGLDNRRMDNATHLIWATGGGMVPDQEFSDYLRRGREVG